MSNLTAFISHHPAKPTGWRRREYWMVTYKEDDLSFPRYRAFMSIELALDFKASLVKLEGGQ